MRSILLLLALPLVLAGCSSGSVAADGDDAKLRVVATTAQLGDIAQQVGGSRVAVDVLLPRDADPHDYEPRPSDARAVAEADVVLQSGGDLDAWLDDVVESAGGDAAQLTLLEHVDTIHGGHGHEEEHEDEEVDPHWWQDPRNAVIAVGVIEQALAAADPAQAQAFAGRADAYRSEIEALDRAVEQCWDEVPPEQRKLVTTHDALGYYAERYGLEVVGAVIPSLSTRGQPSAGELADLVETIRHERVQVVFAESSVSTKVEQAIADEAGVEVGKALWADTLGPEGSDGATYLGSMAANTRAMVDGVTGGAVSCVLPGR